ncbi:MAG: NADPH:quinone oxidoreductase family protein [Acidobacteria bacterium]|nr:NADPH:quinone oxidoreductase family protein [Acidobacteriota bacterium]
MKAIQIHQFGEAEVLRYEDVPEPRPKEGEVLVEVKAAGVNYADILTRRGKYSQKPLPFVPGFEAAGVILETGKGVADWKPGQRVMGTVLRDTSGCYAQKAVMPGWLLLPVPEQFSFEQAASFSEVFVTAHLALHVNGRLAKGESVLIHAAGGGVGTAAVQMARAMGARVFATASTEEKLGKVKQLGADVLINYSSLDFLEEVKKHTDGKGVDVVLESVGGEVFDKSLKCLRPLGRLVAYGTSSAQVAAARVPDLMAGAISVAGFSYGFLTVARPDVIRQAMRAVMELFSQGKIRPVLGHTFPLAQARAAHELISSRASFGKVVLVP